MATKQKQQGSAMDAEAQRMGVSAQRELAETVTPDVNERLDLRVGEHVIATLVKIQTKDSNRDDNRKGHQTFKVYTLQDAHGALWDMLGSADLDGRRELPQLVGHLIGIERIADEQLSPTISPKKKYRIVDYGVKQQDA